MLLVSKQLPNRSLAGQLACKPIRHPFRHIDFKQYTPILRRSPYAVALLLLPPYLCPSGCPHMVHRIIIIIFIDTHTHTRRHGHVRVASGTEAGRQSIDFVPDAGDLGPSVFRNDVVSLSFVGILW